MSTVAAPANRQDSPLLTETLDDVSEALGGLPERTGVHLDRGGYDSEATRERLQERGGLLAEISQKGRPAPLAATKRWMVKRTDAWHNAHKKLMRRTERRGRVIDFPTPSPTSWSS